MSPCSEGNEVEHVLQQTHTRVRTHAHTEPGQPAYLLTLVLSLLSPIRSFFLFVIIIEDDNECKDKKKGKT